MMLPTALLAAISWLHLTTGLEVYDCEDVRSTVARVDLTSTGDCQDHGRLYGPPTSRRAQIVQVSVSRPVSVTRCLVVETRQVTRCGFNSITYGTVTTMWRQALEVGEEECRTAGRTGTLTFRGAEYEVGDERIVQDKFYSRGGRTETDGCKTEDWSEYGRTWVSSYQHVLREVRVERILGTYNEATRTIALGAGLVVNATDPNGHAFDAHQGSLVWSMDRSRCRRANTELYHGMVEVQEKTLTGPHGRTPNPNLKGSLVLARDADRSHAIGLQLRDPAQICDRQCYGTQLEGVIVCFLQALDARMDLVPEQYHREAALISRDAQQAFLHLTAGRRMEEWFAQLSESLCETNREVLTTKLKALASGSSYMLLGDYGLGHKVTVAGAVAYVHRCANKTAIMRDVDRCYREIPVTVDGEPAFADPFTYNLQPFGTEQPCTPVTPVAWHIMGKWYCSEPQVRACPSPIQLRPGQVKLEPQDYAIGIGGGTFSAADQAKHRQYTRVEGARGPASMAHAKHAVSNHDADAGNGLGFGFDLDAAKGSVTQHLLDQFPALGWMGYAAAGLGVLVALGLGRTILLGALRARTLEEDRPGLVSQLLACLCSTSAYRAAQGWKRGRRQRRREKVHREDRAGQAEAGHVPRALPEVPHDLQPLSTFAPPTAPRKLISLTDSAPTSSSGYDTAAQVSVVNESRDGNPRRAPHRRSAGPGAPRRVGPAPRRHSHVPLAATSSSSSSSSDSGDAGPQYLVVKEGTRHEDEGAERRQGPHFPLARAVQSHLAAQRDAAPPAEQGATAGPSAALKGVIF